MKSSFWLFVLVLLPNFIVKVKWQQKGFSVVVVVLMCWWAEMISLGRTDASPAQRCEVETPGMPKQILVKFLKTSKQINYPLDNILKRWWSVLYLTPLFHTLGLVVNLLCNFGYLAINSKWCIAIFEPGNFKRICLF